MTWCSHCLIINMSELENNECQVKLAEKPRTAAGDKCSNWHGQRGQVARFQAALTHAPTCVLGWGCGVESSHVGSSHGGVVSAREERVSGACSRRQVVTGSGPCTGWGSTAQISSGQHVPRGKPQQLCRMQQVPSPSAMCTRSQCRSLQQQAIEYEQAY